ncbi:hypothetical protein [Halapricum desulfuricans]|uniref:Uncharacterized protein n=1 Tax=Halapricum desulfuricans TaxID=2841257 RepID=A0A897NG83_9EURY|nr:hypothetical protein [Halapricum desulfuricans]QSG09486.1 Uncharacterized protein HSR122_2102 [Halapricum desulfuricans]QSG11444.1 Uncharacterized protein HSBGL_1017 [Halapricum desulfuricans]
MTDEPPVLQLHHPADNRFTLRFISDDKQVRSEKATQLSEQSDIEMAIADESVGGETIYLLYTRTLFDAAYPEFETEEEVIEWFDTEFSEGDKQILFAVIDIFDGILTEKEEQGADFSTYKKMDLEKIPGVLNRVEWRQLVPDVGAELLSYFILAHPMPNTNHRTGIGLLDRYLTSYDEGFSMPDTGEEGRWYQWVREFIYDSKRILTLRNQLPLLKWAHQYGYERVERKEGIQIDLAEINVNRTDHRSYYTNRHLDRSCEFVETALNEADATHLQGETDDGKRAFVDRLRGAE